DGVDIGGALFGNSEVAERDLYWLWSSSSSRWALRHGKWKIVRYGRGEPKDAAAWQLFDLAADPKEKRNAALQYPDVLNGMHERFLAHRSKDKR
ncbi:MAG: hypothetical protein QF412_06880, partial [Planctomycetota bacterium]|nr:hypothetical protein [Planctomycetota bacterium]